MIEGELYVLEAVRDILRSKLGLSPEQCECEYDEQIPAIAGNTYVAVIPSGCTPGPKHDTSGGIHDCIHSVQVMVIQRAVTPRDRRRSIFLDRLSGVNLLLSNIIKAIDWQHDVHSLMNHLLWEDDNNASPFQGFLRVSRIDPKPRMINTETYGATSGGQSGATPYVAMARSVYFSGCRRIQKIQQLPPAA